MAITQAMSTLFKKDVLLGDHHLDSDNIYVALVHSGSAASKTPLVLFSVTALLAKALPPVVYPLPLVT